MGKSAYRWQDNSLILNLRVQPCAKRDEIVGFQANVVRIRIKAAPVDGKANKQLVRFISEVFSVPKSNVEIAHGTNSPYKTLVITAPQHIPSNLAHKLRFPPG